MTADTQSSSAFVPARFPLNRVIALLGPYLAVLAGGVTAWASRHFPGLVTNVPATTASITQAATFVVGAAITWALQHKYLDGWQRWEAALAALEAARRGAAATTDQHGDTPRGPGEAVGEDAADAADRSTAGPFVDQPFADFDAALFAPGGGSASDG